MSILVKLKQDNTPHCPVCDHNLDCHTGTNHNSLPKTGDVSFCINCASLLVYNVDKNGISLRLPTEEENVVFDADEEITRVKKSLVEFKSKQHGSN